MTEYSDELNALQNGKELPPRSKLLPLQPFVDTNGILRVDGRLNLSMETYVERHPVILSGKHLFVVLLIQSEHLRLLHAGPTLITASLSRRFHIIGNSRVVRSVTRNCVTCKRVDRKPCPQLLGQLPIDKLNPGPVFPNVGVDYSSPMLIMSGSMRKLVITKAYVCIFACFSVKAVHLELVSDLPQPEDDIETLTPGHFLIRRPH